MVMQRIANPPIPVRFRVSPPVSARVVKLVDTTDLKSVAWVKPAYRFDSGSGHHKHRFIPLPVHCPQDLAVKVRLSNIICTATFFFNHDADLRQPIQIESLELIPGGHMQSVLEKRVKLGGAFRDTRCTIRTARHSSHRRPCAGLIPTRLRSLKRRTYQCLLIVFCACLAPGLAQAKGSNIPAVNLISPETVRGVLAKYFVLPDNLLVNENDRAIFMRRAQREIPELLATEGYFSSNVVLRSVTPAGVLELEVIPGRRTVVTEVNIEFRGDLSLLQNDARMKQLRADWSLRPGMPFRASDWDEAKAGLLAQVASRDYAAARLVESSARVDPAKANAKLHVVVDSGPRFLFGELQVSGLQRYKPSLINRYASFRPGQPYDRKLLLAFQNQLQSMPQFSSVLVNYDIISAEKQAGPLTVPVRVKIVEAQSRKISLGIGYSTNNGVRNQIDYQSYNFLNQAWTLNSSWIFEQNRQTLSALLGTQPNPLGYRLTWNASGEKTQIQGLETRTYKIRRDTQPHPVRHRNRHRPEWAEGTANTARWYSGIRDRHWCSIGIGIGARSTTRCSRCRDRLTQLLVGGASKSVLSDQNFVRSYFRRADMAAVGWARRGHASRRGRIHRRHLRLSVSRRTTCSASAVRRPCAVLRIRAWALSKAMRWLAGG